MVPSAPNTTDQGTKAMNTATAAYATAAYAPSTQQQKDMDTLSEIRLALCVAQACAHRHDYVDIKATMVRNLKLVEELLDRTRPQY